MSGLDRVFHYVVPEALAPEVEVGTIVRVPLHGRRVRGFVVGRGSPPPEGVRAQEILSVVSLGPSPEAVALCRWAAWRYGGRLRPFLRAASPTTTVRRLPPLRSHTSSPEHPSFNDGEAAPSRGAVEGAAPSRGAIEEAAGRALGEAVATSVREAVGLALRAGDAVVRLPPAAERLPFVLEALEATRTAPGDPMILVESQADATLLARRLRARGWDTSIYPEQWAEAAAGGGVVIGTRNVAFAPGRRSLILVLDAHSEAYRSERAPTFDARVVVAERARRQAATLVYVSSCPSVELLDGRNLVTLGHASERRGWPTVSIFDAREEDPRERGYPSRLVALLRREAPQGSPERPLVLVLNARGRARVLACPLCRTIQRCGRCGRARFQDVAPPEGAAGRLTCPSCGDDVPALCTECGSARLRVVRPGVSLAREELSVLLGVEVGEVPAAGEQGAAVLLGPESVLHAVRAACLVVFLDLDHELLAARFRAAEQALVLIGRAARLVGGRDEGGRLIVRTSIPDHEVVRAAQVGSPELLTAAEEVRRALLRLPPVTALAELSGGGAPEAAQRLSGVEVADVGRGRFIVRATSSAVLADALAELVAGEPAGWAALDVRVEVDPLGV